jgi:hypothetical protein
MSRFKLPRFRKKQPDIRSLFNAGGSQFSSSSLGYTPPTFKDPWANTQGQSSGKVAKIGEFFDKYGNIIGTGAEVLLGLRRDQLQGKDSAADRQLRERTFLQELAQRQAEFERNLAISQAEQERRRDELELRRREEERIREEQMYNRQQGEARSQRVTDQLGPFLNAMRNR